MRKSEPQLNLIIGSPLTHTQSPLLHNTLYSLLNYNAIMKVYPTADLSSSIKMIRLLEKSLIAITMPFKNEVLLYLDYVSEESRHIHTVNTILSHSGKLYGYNTDIQGIAYALRNISSHKKNVLLLGAGGAAHAAAYYFKRNKSNIYWMNRTVNHAQLAIKRFGGAIINDEQAIASIRIDIIVNTTPLGMVPMTHSSPLNNYKFNSGQIVFDMIYNPIETLLLKNARAQGATCISGIDMFIGQGIKQIEIWQNQSINNDIIFALKEKLIQSQNKIFTNGQLEFV